MRTSTCSTAPSGALSVSGQSLWVVAVSVLMIVALYFYFGRTVSGKALRATAVNRLGARLVGIGTTQAGRLAFTLAAALGATMELPTLDGKSTISSFRPIPGYTPKKAEDAFGRYENVLTSIQFERMLSLTSPSGGIPVRPSDGRWISSSANSTPSFTRV